MVSDGHGKVLHELLESSPSETKLGLVLKTWDIHVTIFTSMQYTVYIYMIWYSMEFFQCTFTSKPFNQSSWSPPKTEPSLVWKTQLVVQANLLKSMLSDYEIFNNTNFPIKNNGSNEVQFSWPEWPQCITAGQLELYEWMKDSATPLIRWIWGKLIKKW